MADQHSEWLIDDIPGTDDPDVVRAYIRDLRAIEDHSPVIRDMIESAERLIVDLERERAQNAA